MRHQQAEGSRPQNRAPDDVFPTDAVADWTSQQGTGSRCEQEDEQIELLVLYRHSEFMNQVKGIITVQAGHVNVFREYQDNDNPDDKDRLRNRIRHFMP